MRKHRRHSPMLEVLDERIVPSGVGMAPIGHAALTEHSAIHHAAHELKIHVAVHPKVVLDARVHHDRIVPAAQVSSGLASSSSVVLGRPTSGAATASAVTPATAVSASATGQAQVPTVATAAISTSVTPASTNANAAVISQSATTSAAATTDPGDIQNGPLAKAGQDLITIYEEFEQQGGSATFTSSEAGLVRIAGTSVGVDVHSAGGNFANLVSAMTALGMQVQTQDATDGVVEGLLPIGELLAAAQNSQTLSLTPEYIRRLD